MDDGTSTSIISIWIHELEHEYAKRVYDAPLQYN